MKKIVIIFTFIMISGALLIAADTGPTPSPVPSTSFESGVSGAVTPELSRDVITPPVRIAVGLAQLLLAMLIGFAVIGISLRMAMSLTKNFDDTAALANNNSAVGILLGSFIFGVTLLVKRSLYPVFSIIGDLARSPETGAGLIGTSLMYITAYITISLATALVIAVLSLKLFDRMTRTIDELGEIMKNNNAVALYYAAIFISLCYFIEEGLHALLVTLLPLPKIV